VPNPQPVILLPPSEGKAAGGDGPPWRPGTMADAGLDRHRTVVLRAARAAGVTTRRAPTMAAIERYTGVLYRELDWTSLPAAARRRGSTQVRIASGLWGLAAPSDPICDYRLRMSASLDGLGRMAGWWRPRLAPVLADLVADRVVWDLLPNEHAAACDWPATGPGRRVTLRVVDADGRTVSHWNKLLKGAIVRWILTERPAGPEDLVGFDHPAGYRFDPEASDLGPERAAVVLRAGRPATRPRRRDR
jgi:uncharacterized protein